MTLRERLEDLCGSNCPNNCTSKFDRFEGARIALESMPCGCVFNYAVSRSVAVGPTVAQQCARCQRLAELSAGDGS